jgi:hypothetical protein
MGTRSVHPPSLLSHLHKSTEDGRNVNQQNYATVLSLPLRTACSELSESARRTVGRLAQAVVVALDQVNTCVPAAVCGVTRKASQSNFAPAHALRRSGRSVGGYLPPSLLLRRTSSFVRCHTSTKEPAFAPAPRVVGPRRTRRAAILGRGPHGVPSSSTHHACRILVGSLGGTGNSLRSPFRDGSGKWAT